jgi:hypothetical protein
VEVMRSGNLGLDFDLARPGIKRGPYGEKATARNGGETERWEGRKPDGAEGPPLLGKPWISLFSVRV